MTIKNALWYVDNLTLFDEINIYKTADITKVTNIRFKSVLIKSLYYERNVKLCVKYKIITIFKVLYFQGCKSSEITC